MTPEEQAIHDAAVAKAAADKAAADKAAADEAARVAEAARIAALPPVSDEVAALVKDVMKKKEALAAATANAKDLAEKLKAFEGIDPVAIKKLVADKAAADEAELIRKGEFEQIRKQMNDAHALALTAKDVVVAEKDVTIGSLQTTISNLTVGNAFESSTYIKEDLTPSAGKVRQLYGTHFEFKDGKVVGYDKPTGEKDRAPLVDSKGEPLPFNDALKKIVDADADKDTILKSKVAAGAASTTTNGKAKALAATDADKGPPKLKGAARIAAGLAAQEAAKKK